MQYKVYSQTLGFSSGLNARFQTRGCGTSVILSVFQNLWGLYLIRFFPWIYLRSLEPQYHYTNSSVVGRLVLLIATSCCYRSASFISQRMTELALDQWLAEVTVFMVVPSTSPTSQGHRIMTQLSRNILIVQGFYCRLCTLWIMELMRCFVIGPDVGNISTTINDDQPGIQRESMTACYREMHMDSHVDLKDATVKT
ncbi:hypothetical protein AcV5_004482 [Taiwanofungus camphoratus]|nr:hypothetical protein AcV5_004482 [Antrodia cinnamomea]